MSAFYNVDQPPFNMGSAARAIAAANNGLLFDPSDMSTMFQDSAGTTPVTAVEQPVGLILDKSQWLMLGPELVSNGTFDSDISGWGSSSAGATLTWVSAAIRVTSDSGGFDDAQQLLTTIPGKFYIATCKKLQGGGDAGKLRIVASGGAELSRSPYSSSAQTNLQTVFKATSSISAVQVFVDKANSYADFDNISVRELYGYHATQSVTASRPTLSARYNLLTKTEDFSDAVWSSGVNTSVTPNIIYAPDGMLSVDKITITDTNYAYKRYQIAVLPSTKYTFSYYLETTLSASGCRYRVYDLTNATNIVSETYCNYSGGGFVRQARTFTTPANCTSIMVYVVANNPPYAGAYYYIWGADLRLGASAGPYQRVNTATDYDTNPALFPKYLKFDGVDDYLNLPFMNLYGGGAASIIAALDAVSQATDTYIISERSTSNANPKYFPSRQLAGRGNMDSYISDDTAAVVLNTIGSAFSGASDKVIRSVVDTGNNIKLFKNGVLAANDNYTRSGALTLNNTTIGASVSTTTGSYASMKLYGLIITKSALTDAQRVRCERFLAQKAGVML